MKKYMIALCALVFCVSTYQLKAQAQADQQAAAMKAWQDYMTPGDTHKMLAKAEGDWTYEVSLWMDPASPPTKSTGTATNKMIMGGRYQESRYSGSMMGMPFEGYNLLGYDNARKVFQSSWVDNMGTGVMQMEGKLDVATKIIKLAGKAVDPSTGKEMNVRETFLWVDNDTQKMEMFETRDGKEVKTMEIIFKRKV